MSVINQALRQLDHRAQRQSQGVDILITAPHRPSHVGRLGRVVGGVVLLFAVGGIGGYWLAQQQPTLLKPSPPATPTLPALAAPPPAQPEAAPPPTATPLTRAAPLIEPTPPPYPAPAATGSIPAATPPFISGLSPNPTPASLIRQLYTLSGSGLQAVAAAEICLPSGRCQPIPSTRFVQQEESTIQLYLIPGSGPEQWSIQLLSPNGNSNRYQLDILPPPPAPPPTPPTTATATERVARPIPLLPNPPNPPIPQPASPAPAPKGGGQFTKKSRPLSPTEQVQQLYQQGVQQQQSGDREAAIQSWRRALEINPQHHASREAAVNLLLLTTASQPEAVTLLLNGIAVASNYASYRLLLARLYSNNPNQIPKAVDLLKEGLADQPNHAEMNATLAALYQRQGQHSQVLSHYRTALNSEPQHARWWIGLAISQEALGNSQGALASYQQAVRQNDPLLTGQLASFVQRKIETLQP